MTLHANPQNKCSRRMNTKKTEKRSGEEQQKERSKDQEQDKLLRGSVIYKNKEQTEWLTIQT